MKWKPCGETALISDCKRYSVAKYGTGAGWRYEAWHLGNPSVLIETLLPSPEEAKALCEADLLRKAA